MMLIQLYKFIDFNFSRSKDVVSLLPKLIWNNRPVIVHQNYHYAHEQCRKTDDECSSL